LEKAHEARRNYRNAAWHSCKNPAPENEKLHTFLDMEPRAVPELFFVNGAVWG